VTTEAPAASSATHASQIRAPNYRQLENKKDVTKYFKKIVGIFNIYTDHDG
jgi:hypothetical protein